MLILGIAVLAAIGFGLDMACKLIRLDHEMVALEIELAQVIRQRDHLADVLARYEAPLDLKTLRWVMGSRGLVLLTLN